jgi:metal-sulfur cluster biosynthetic enzyme
MTMQPASSDFGQPFSLSQRRAGIGIEIADAQIAAALNGVVDPCSIATGRPITILDMGLVRSVAVEGSAVHVVLRLTSPFCFQVPLIREEIERRLAAIGYACEVGVDTADEWLPEMMSTEAREDLRRIRERPARL